MAITLIEFSSSHSYICYGLIWNVLWFRATTTFPVVHVYSVLFLRVGSHVAEPFVQIISTIVFGCMIFPYCLFSCVVTCFACLIFVRLIGMIIRIIFISQKLYIFIYTAIHLPLWVPLHLVTLHSGDFWPPLTPTHRVSSFLRIFRISFCPHPRSVSAI